MRKTVIGFALTALLLALSYSVSAQQPKKVSRIGYLSALDPASESLRSEAIRLALRELGYIEGQNIAIEYRYAEDKLERFHDIAADLVRLKPNVIVVGSTRFAEAAKQATSTIPIVVNGGDIVGAGLAASLARPGGNVTGSTAISPDLSGKRIEVLKEIVPKALRVAVLWYPGGRDEDEVKQTEITARVLGVKVQSLPVRDPNEFQSAYTAMTKQRADAHIIIQGSFTSFHRKQLLELAAKNRPPSMCEVSVWTEDGCIVSYGPDQLYRWRRAAYFVDKILTKRQKASRPARRAADQVRVHYQSESG